MFATDSTVTAASRKLANARAKGTKGDARKDERAAFGRAVRRAGRVSARDAADEFDDERDFEADCRFEDSRLECLYDL